MSQTTPHHGQQSPAPQQQQGSQSGASQQQQGTPVAPRFSDWASI